VREKGRERGSERGRERERGKGGVETERGLLFTSLL
jgi:hypothetical protein